MGLKDRLTRLTGDTPKPLSADAKQDRITELRRKLDRAMNRRAQGAPTGVPRTRRQTIPLQDVITGEEIQTPHGSFFVSRSIMQAGDVHGSARICDLACTSLDAVTIIAGLQMAEGISMGDGLFLDTETTGLAGGTGTFPFLIGLGWFEASTFVTCQLFARDFSEEGAMLRYLCELARRRCSRF
jgi:uncharacterized protein YprB with RNaseH-like and TPR domain